MSNSEIAPIKAYVRAANYLTAAQLYLLDNFLLERKLSFDDIKSRLLGHWGTCPGINFVYANLNALIKKHGAKMMFVLGPGHGFPALQANLFIEGTLGKYYPEATQDERGAGYVIKNFSWPYGFPSHSNPGTPGVILEGGELGYSLSTSYGAVLDNPDLFVACLVGDGEAETGPTATAWHLNKFIDPKTCGAVLPILHLNGYKISGPTIFGRMGRKDLKNLFSGYGYEPHFVSGTGDKIYEKMAAVMEQCYQSIKNIQKQAREGAGVVAPRFPMIILETPKGWTGIKKLRGKKIEGNCLAHQIVAPNTKTEKEELHAVEKWLRSYNFAELFDKEKGFIEEIKQLVPEPSLCMGNNPHAFGGKILKDLILPPADTFAEDATKPGTVGSSSMRRAGLYLNEVFKLNPENFRMLSPDETYSNKLDEVFKTTARAFVGPTKAWDEDLKPSGRVMEMLSEHSLQGLMQGYILTGRHAVFASYEAFIQIISSMVDQYLKFLKVAREIPWRGQVASLNFILTSSGWRQEHNGFSHQNPGFVSNVLLKPGCLAHAYFPPDGNTTLAVLKHCFESRNEVNLIIAGKTLEPRWLTPAQAQEELKQGLMTWDFASDAEPDIVLAACGDYLTKECLAAIDIIKREAPEIKIRFVNILELSALGIGGETCRVRLEFEKYFTKDKPVIFNFHGYPETIKQFLFDKGGDHRFMVKGYIENGSTTTPFDMHVRNRTSRWHLAKEVFARMANAGVIETNKAETLHHVYDKKLEEHAAYIKTHGVDLDEVENWVWNKKS
ncbi:MAG: phosphoketolase family protein [bacterium]|nr:phosphoketolase family protein [bacterium]